MNAAEMAVVGRDLFVEKEGRCGIPRLFAQWLIAFFKNRNSCIITINLISLTLALDVFPAEIARTMTFLSQGSVGVVFVWRAITAVEGRVERAQLNCFLCEQTIAVFAAISAFVNRPTGELQAVSKVPKMLHVVAWVLSTIYGNHCESL